MPPASAASPSGSYSLSAAPPLVGSSSPLGTSPPPPEAGLLEAALFEVKKVIVGQERVIERLFVCLLAQGHCLLEGVPGLAKTLAMETLARTVGGTFSRLQFTPDLLPADIVGTRIYRHSTEAFDVELGPVFANFVLADEVNRAPAKVQSALLEVMAERHVSIAGRTFDVPEPFLVLATQNPIESEGVYALPEAQRDRFLMKVLVGYPSWQEEVEIVHRIGMGSPSVRQVLSAADLLRLQQAARDVYVDRSVVDYAVNLVLATRQPASFGLAELEPLIDYGASPRASLGLVSAGRALALLRGRRYALPQDIFDVAPEVLRHRLVLSYEALAQGLVVDQLTARVLSTVPAPRVTPVLEGAGYPATAPSPVGHQVAEAPSTQPTSLPTMRPTPAAPPAPAAAAPPAPTRAPTGTADDEQRRSDRGRVEPRPAAPGRGERESGDRGAPPPAGPGGARASGPAGSPSPAGRQSSAPLVPPAPPVPGTTPAPGAPPAPGTPGAAAAPPGRSPWAPTGTDRPDER